MVAQARIVTLWSQLLTCFTVFIVIHLLHTTIKCEVHTAFLSKDMVHFISPLYSIVTFYYLAVHVLGMWYFMASMFTTLEINVAIRTCHISCLGFARPWPWPFTFWPQNRIASYARLVYKINFQSHFVLVL